MRVKGLPPAASDLQFIDNETVRAAQTRQVHVLDDEPLLCGLDVARGGADHNVFRFRRGRDARSIPAIKIHGSETRDTTRLVDKAADLLERGIDGQKIAHLMIDGTGIGGPIFDRLKQLGHKNITEVQFGAKCPQDRKYANMRAFMWGRMRDWLPGGAIDDSSQLEQDLTGPGYTHDKQDRVILESKEHMKGRGVDSPDNGDALAMTFATATVAQKKIPFMDHLRAGEGFRPRRPGSGWAWQ